VLMQIWKLVLGPLTRFEMREEWCPF